MGIPAGRGADYRSAGIARRARMPGSMIIADRPRRPELPDAVIFADAAAGNKSAGGVLRRRLGSDVDSRS